MKIKVCGMKYKDNIVDLLTLPVNYIGFIFYANSPRYVGQDFNIDFLDNNIQIKKTGVFVNDTIENVLNTVKKYKLDFVQLHGNEQPEFCDHIAEQNIQVIKAFQIDNNFDFQLTVKYRSSCTYFLFDTKTTSYGGSGNTFNWDVLNKYDNEVPYFLSGGIDINMADKIKSLSSKFNIHAIDLNSRFEIEPGLKDIEKINNFITLL